MLRISAYAGFCRIFGVYAEAPIFAVPAFTARKQPASVLLKGVAKVVTPYFKSAGRHHYLRASVTRFFHLKIHFLKAIFSDCII